MIIPIICIKSKNRKNYKDKYWKWIFFFTELSSSVNELPFPNVNRLRNIHYYADLNGAIRPINELHMPDIAKDSRYVFGVRLHGYVCPIYDRNQHHVLVFLQNNQNVEYSQSDELHKRYGPLFVQSDSYSHAEASATNRKRRRHY